MHEYLSLHQVDKEEVQNLSRELAEKLSPEVRPRLTFVWPLPSRRKELALAVKSGQVEPSLVKEALSEGDFIDRLVGRYLLSSCSKSEFSPREKKAILSGLVKDCLDSDLFFNEEFFIKSFANFGAFALPWLRKLYGSVLGQRIAIHSLGRLGGEGLKELGKFTSGSKVPKDYAAESLGEAGEAALPLLRQLSSDYNQLVREKIVISLGKIRGRKSLALLEELSKDQNFRVRERIAKVLLNFGEEGLPLLRQLAKDSDPGVRLDVLITLTKLGEKGWADLKMMTEDSSTWVAEKAKEILENGLPIYLSREEVDNSDLKDVPRRWLLSTRKPLFATPNSEKLCQRLNKIAAAASELRQRFGEEFIGLIIFGSTAMGYFRSNSDTDIMVVTENIDALDYFWSRYEKDLVLCHPYRFFPQEKKRTHNELSMIFSGVFFGDFARLCLIQKKALAGIKPRAWDLIRYEMLGHLCEKSVASAIYRFTAGGKIPSRDIIFNACLRIPPTYQETLEIVRRRAQQ